MNSKFYYYILFLALLLLILTLIIFFSYQQTSKEFIKIYNQKQKKLERYSKILYKYRRKIDSLKLIHKFLQINKEAINTNKYYLVLDVSTHYFYLMKKNYIIYSDIFGSGKGSILIKGKKFNFDTPKTELSVIKKISNPWWIRPNWFWTEKNLPIPKKFIKIPDNLDYIDAIRFYNNLSYKDKLKVKKVPGVLGKYKIVLRDGLLIHYGKHLGQNSSHGCIRVSQKAINILFTYLKTGSPIFIY